MTKSVVVLIIAMLIFVSCNRRKANANHSGKFSDEAAITTLAFNESVYPDTVFKGILLEIGPGAFQAGFRAKIKLDKKDQKKFDLETDSLRKKLDTAGVYVLIVDSLLDIHEIYLRSRFLNKSRLDEDMHTNYIVNAWRKEIIVNKTSGGFSMDNLLSKYHYKYSLKSKFHQPKGNVFVAGVFSVSRVFFNKKKDKAFVYSTFVCGDLCGEGRDIYLAKIKGKWQIVSSITDWVS